MFLSLVPGLCYAPTRIQRSFAFDIVNNTSHLTLAWVLFRFFGHVTKCFLSFFGQIQNFFRFWSECRLPRQYIILTNTPTWTPDQDMSGQPSLLDFLQLWWSHGQYTSGYDHQWEQEAGTLEEGGQMKGRDLFSVLWMDLLFPFLMPSTASIGSTCLGTVGWALDQQRHPRT